MVKLPPVDMRYSHETLEQIKINVILDGDLAASLMNIMLLCDGAGVLYEMLMCEHVAPKLLELVELLKSKLDIENRVEE